ncbi:hypothetical protein HAX54_035328 [Datura stramonium]|uniref:Uncharacterized protein n=1 Tax=Datura stramonium TaxID=4076 RepID=A0ABS8VIG8_DATST|nr:hypothetical protein [Datura stramonium]
MVEVVMSAMSGAHKTKAYAHALCCQVIHEELCGNLQLSFLACYLCQEILFDPIQVELFLLIELLIMSSLEEHSLHAKNDIETKGILTLLLTKFSPSFLILLRLRGPPLVWDQKRTPVIQESSPLPCPFPLGPFVSLHEDERFFSNSSYENNESSI